MSSRDSLLSYCTESGTAAPQATRLNLEGGWYATLRIPNIQSEEDWCLELLALDDVLVQPGYFFDFPSEAFLVLSLLTAPAVFDAGVTRLCRRIESAVA